VYGVATLMQETGLRRQSSLRSLLLQLLLSVPTETPAGVRRLSILACQTCRSDGHIPLQITGKIDG